VHDWFSFVFRVVVSSFRVILLYGSVYVITSYALASTSFRFSSKSVIVNADSGGSLTKYHNLWCDCVKLGIMNWESTQQWTSVDNKRINCDFLSYFKYCLYWEYSRLRRDIGHATATVICVLEITSTVCLTPYVLIVCERHARYWGQVCCRLFVWCPELPN